MKLITFTTAFQLCCELTLKHLRIHQYLEITLPIQLHTRIGFHEGIIDIFRFNHPINSL